MIPPKSVIRETERRFAKRQSEREATLAKIEAGELVSANDPERVQERMLRLARAQTVFTAEAAAAPPAPTADTFALERVLGKSDLVSVTFLDLALRAARAVGRVRIQTKTGRTVGYGTGFMVSPRLLLTNNHVLEDESTAAPSLVEFDYQESLDGQTVTPALFAFQPDVFFLTDRSLDYTLVAVRETSLDGGKPLVSFGWLPLVEKQGKVLKGEYMNIIQHPNGDLKRLAFRENLLVDLFDDFLHYKTDTAPGSSGAPVLNDQWEVVALHHSGVPARDGRGNILSVDGQPWTEDMGEHLIRWEANEGIRASRLVQHVNAQSLTGERARLREAMFAAPPALPSAAVSKPEVVIEQPNARPDGDTITWTLPLQVTVRLGQPSAPLAVSAAVIQPLQEVPVDDPELREALAELEAARSRDYYDAKADQKAAGEYYHGVPADADAKTLYETLSELARSTHTTRLRYQPMKQVYPWVDLYPDLKLRSVYSGKTFEPEAIIREDFQIDRERTARLHELMLAEAAFSTERLQEELSLLEAALPYNCEHVVPQSWFDKKEPMRGDLHHLFTCEMTCNSFRGNTPYFDFPDFLEVVRDDCGKRDGKSFEPSAGKGLVARATLYFLLRYPGEVNDTGDEFLRDRLPILLDWHRSNPITEHERHRNMVIFARQGNRNPLIDHPEWAEKIDFSLGMG